MNSRKNKMTYNLIRISYYYFNSFQKKSRVLDGDGSEGTAVFLFYNLFTLWQLGNRLVGSNPFITWVLQNKSLFVVLVLAMFVITIFALRKSGYLESTRAIIDKLTARQKSITKTIFHAYVIITISANLFVLYGGELF